MHVSVHVSVHVGGDVSVHVVWGPGRMWTPANTTKHDTQLPPACMPDTSLANVGSPEP